MGVKERDSPEDSHEEEEEEGDFKRKGFNNNRYSWKTCVGVLFLSLLELHQTMLENEDTQEEGPWLFLRRGKKIPWFLIYVQKGGQDVQLLVLLHPHGTVWLFLTKVVDRKSWDEEKKTLLKNTVWFYTMYKRGECNFITSQNDKKRKKLQVVEIENPQDEWEKKRDTRGSTGLQEKEEILRTRLFQRTSWFKKEDCKGRKDSVRCVWSKVSFSLKIFPLLPLDFSCCVSFFFRSIVSPSPPFLSWVFLTFSCPFLLLFLSQAFFFSVVFIFAGEKEEIFTTILCVCLLLPLVLFFSPAVNLWLNERKTEEKEDRK